jgi:hypothetical protein
VSLLGGSSNVGAACSCTFKNKHTMDEFCLSRERERQASGPGLSDKAQWSFGTRYGDATRPYWVYATAIPFPISLDLWYDEFIETV